MLGTVYIVLALDLCGVGDRLDGLGPGGLWCWEPFICAIGDLLRSSLGKGLWPPLCLGLQGVEVCAEIGSVLNEADVPASFFEYSLIVLQLVST